jgi:iron complex transport system substrate-binding protein
MRIVSLLPAATEIVAALGALDRLVGVTHECDHPAEAAGLPRVTGTPVDVDASAAEVDARVRDLAAGGAPIFTLDERLIAELRPTLLLTQALCDVCAVSEADVRALAVRLDPTPAVATLGGSTLDGVLADVERVGAAAGLPERAAALVDAFHARMLAVHETLKAARAPRPRVAVVEWTAPVYAAGHWVPEMVRRAGGVDVIGVAGTHSPQVAMDALAAGEPEVVIFAPCGYALDRAAAEAEAVIARAEWRWLRGRAVWAVDANALVSRPGPRLVDGIETFARLMHPALLGPPAATHARRVR